VNVNPGYRVAELEYALNKVECRAIITAHRFKTSHYIGMLRGLAPEPEHCAPGRLKSARLPLLTTAIHMTEADEAGFYTLNQIAGMGGALEQARLADLAGLLQSDEPINIQFTSGTTGSPKAATLTPHGLINNALFFAEGAGVTNGTRFCNPLPLYHVGGMVLGSIASVSVGATIVYLGQTFDPLATLEAVQAEKCDALGGVRPGSWRFGITLRFLSTTSLRCAWD
jgi:fatty-acyl-CoA synthase